MLKTTIRGLDQNLLRAGTRAELAKLGLLPVPDSGVHAGPLPEPLSVLPPGEHSAPPALLDDLLAEHGEKFLDQAWIALTRTQPNPEQLKPFLEGMRSGEMNKVEVLDAIRKTPEGRTTSVPLPGLALRLLPFRLARLPVIGAAIRWAIALYRLPEHWRRVNVLWSCREASSPDRLPPQARNQTPVAPLTKGHAVPPGLAELYLAFENTFRGSREDIKERLRVYLPYLEQIGDGSPQAPILDIGCGRGEWLELLRDQGKQVFGVDLNHASVALCRELGLQAHVADAMEHLGNLPARSLGAVTAFHLIEHLPLEAVVALLDSVHHALAPGGILILETPNPENLLVSACSFHRDPTHLRPIHPETALFLLNQRGFRDVRYSGLNPFASPDMDQVPEGFLRRLFFAPQDYMIIGYRQE